MSNQSCSKFVLSDWMYLDRFFDVVKVKLVPWKLPMQSTHSTDCITVSFQLVGRKLLYIFKENFLPNAFYLFLPLFKHQTTPYNVLFFQKMKKYAFLFSFQTGTGSQWEGPHINNKATCLQSKFTIHYILLFSTYYTTLFSKFMQKIL